MPLIYFGDTARYPYGNKSAETVVRYAVENTRFLIDQGAQVIVVACNTATAVALKHLQSSFSVPIYGVVDPAVSQAVSKTKTGHIGVMATSRTVKTDSYTKAILKQLPTATVTAIACPLLVSVIEEGSPSEEATRLIVRAYLRPLKEHTVDTLILGCTHYPLMQSLIQEEMGPTVAIVDPAHTCADAVMTPFLSPLTEQPSGTSQFFASDDAERFKKVGETFLGRKMGDVHIVHHA
jgi:glutamate racemase